MSNPTPPKPDLRAAAVQGLRWTAIVRPAIEVVFLGSMVVLARLISPAEFGRFAIASIVQDLAVTIVMAGVGTALVQRPSVTRDHLRAGAAVSLLLGTGLTVLSLVVAVPLFDLVFGARVGDLVQLSAPLFLISGASTVPLAIMRRRLQFRALSLIDMAATMLRAAVSVALAVAGLGAEALVVGALAAGAVTLVLAWIVAPAPAPLLRRQPIRDLLGVGVPSALAAASWIGFRNCDYAIVGARLGAVQAGLYFRAYTLAVEYQKKVSIVVGQIGFPMLSRTGGDAERAELTGRMVRLLSVTLFPLLALLAVVAPALVPWLFGSEWSAAVEPTQILVIGGAATLVIDVIGAELMAAGRATALLVFGTAHFVVYAAVVFVVAPFGLVAVAGAAAVIHAAFMVVAYSITLKANARASLAAVWRDLAPAVVPCAALVLATLPLAAALGGADAGALLQIAIVSLVGGAVYLAVLRLLFRSAWSEIWTLVRAVLPARSAHDVGPGSGMPLAETRQPA